MTKYTTITFTKLSEAIAYVEDGGYLCQLDSGFAYEIDDFETLIKCWREPLFTKSKPAQWHEKLDGTVENGALCWASDEYSAKNGANHICLITTHLTNKSKKFKDNTCTIWESAKPLTRAEIQRFMDNAPEEP